MGSEPDSQPESLGSIAGDEDAQARRLDFDQERLALARNVRHRDRDDVPRGEVARLGRRQHYVVRVAPEPDLASGFLGQHGRELDPSRAVEAHAGRATHDSPEVVVDERLAAAPQARARPRGYDFALVDPD